MDVNFGVAEGQGERGCRAGAPRFDADRFEAEGGIEGDERLRVAGGHGDVVEAGNGHLRRHCRGEGPGAARAQATTDQEM
ncbi:MAG: hypothetical protein U5Q44_13235 [Dehalococcoidia bacterium]|nr:hypothetical protein [Dehalococcoidia bacterium]